MDKIIMVFYYNFLIGGEDRVSKIIYAYKRSNINDVTATIKMWGKYTLVDGFTPLCKNLV